MNSSPKLIYDSLAHIDIGSLLNCFNKSFENYFVNLQLTKEQLLERLYAEGIDLKLSFGAFDGKTLVAFILHGIDILNNDNVAHNAGTGVLPCHRGKGLSFSLYEYCIPQLKIKGIKKTTLEVFVENIAAIKTYHRIGFVSIRKLLCYKGYSNCKIDPSVEIKMLCYPDWNIVSEMCDWERSWQYNNNTLKRAWNNYSMLMAYSGANVEAYCIVNFKNARVANFGVKNKNNLQYLSALFAYIENAINLPLMIVNIDEAATETNRFLKSIGLEQFITSYEMEKDLT